MTALATNHQLHILAFAVYFEGDERELRARGTHVRCFKRGRKEYASQPSGWVADVYIPLLCSPDFVTLGLLSDEKLRSSIAMGTGPLLRLFARRKILRVVRGTFNMCRHVQTYVTLGRALHGRWASSEALPTTGKTYEVARGGYVQKVRRYATLEHTQIDQNTTVHYHKQ